MVLRHRLLAENSLGALRIFIPLPQVNTQTQLTCSCSDSARRISECYFPPGPGVSMATRVVSLRSIIFRARNSSYSHFGARATSAFACCKFAGRPSRTNGTLHHDAFVSRRLQQQNSSDGRRTTERLPKPDAVAKKSSTPKTRYGSGCPSVGGIRIGRRRRPRGGLNYTC